MFRHVACVAAAAARDAVPSAGAGLAPAGAPPPGYEVQWRRLAEAALELDLGPDELAETGLDPLAAAREWKPATVALYSKVARYGGLALPRPRTPEPDPQAAWTCARSPSSAEPDPEHVRAVAWCALALALARAGRHVPLAAPGPGARRRPPARGRAPTTASGRSPARSTAWHAWETVRDRFPALAASPWVLPALRRGPGLDSRIGGRLSNQALQVTFAKHAGAHRPAPAGHRSPVARRTPPRSWRRPTATSPTTPTAGWPWRPALPRCPRAVWCGPPGRWPGRRGARAPPAEQAGLPPAQSRESCSPGSAAAGLRDAASCSPAGPDTRQAGGRQAAGGEPDLLVARHAGRRGSRRRPGAAPRSAGPARAGRAAARPAGPARCGTRPST